MEIRKNVILAPYTTFWIGGPARYFCEARSIDDLKSALKFSKEKNLRFFILGGGSNILVSDKGFDGLVIKMNIRGLWITDLRSRLSTGLTVGAGEMWDDVVASAVKRGLCGIENLSLIPGTVGGAVCQNIGAYGVELKDVLEGVEALDADSGEIKTFSNSDCEFGYRNSVFKKRGGLVVLKISLRFSKNLRPNINYPDLAKRFEGIGPSVTDVRQAVIEIRKKKLPYPTEIPGWAKAPPKEPSPSDEIGNAGSFFKNPTIKISNFQFLISKHSDLKGFDRGDGLVKLAAAQLIEKCGWKGKVFGNVGVSKKHSLVLVNHGNGTSEEITNLADNITKSIKKEFGVVLEPEVEVI